MNLDWLIDKAIAEDLPQGDLTTRSLGIDKHIGEAHLIAKEDLVLSGTKVFQRTIEKIAPESTVQWNFSDGDLVLNQQIVAVIEGNLIEILQAERIGLNFLGHLCGIATLTHCFVKKIEGTDTKILDTRKTTPGYRELEKQAVLDGKGSNHRMNLSDGILLKENHLEVAGGLKEAIDKIRENSEKPIEVEVKNLDEVRQAIELRADRIMLDNMSLDEMKAALEITPKSIETEASGNMNLERVRPVAELGVDFISIGALTHSAPCADLSMLFMWKEEDEDL